MTTIVQPRAIHFTLPSATGLAAAFVESALDEAGFGGHGFPAEGAPFALLHAAIQEGLDGDRPASVIFLSGSGLQAAPGWGDQGEGFFPVSPAFVGEGEVEVYLNGATGAWWIAEAGVLRCLCSRIRRFHADMAEGVFSRYVLMAIKADGGTSHEARGLLHDGEVYDPGIHRSAATRATNAVHFFSPIGPLGLFGGFMGARLPDTLPPTVAPIFPFLCNTSEPVPPVYMGELLDLMVATDGFAPGAAPLPGWRLLKAAPEAPFFYAVPMPPA